MATLASDPLRPSQARLAPLRVCMFVLDYFVRALESFLIRRVDRAITVSESIAGELSRRYGAAGRLRRRAPLLVDLYASLEAER